MFRAIAVVCCLLLTTLFVQAQEVRMYIHRAEAGDTLTKLANRYLTNRSNWQIFEKFNAIRNTRAIPVGTLIKIPVSAMRADVATVEVLATKGPVTSGTDIIAAGSKVAEGGKLTTGEGGFVTIRLADGSTLTVQPKSSVRLETARQLANTGGVTDTVIRLDSGRVETSVARQKNSAARYEIRTPTSNMGVRGTVFRAGADESGKRGQGEVVEGLVAVTGTAPADALPLKAGFGTFVEAGKPPAPPIALLPAPDVTALLKLFSTPDIRFAFQAVAGAVSYRAQVALDSAFTNLVAGLSSTTPDAAFTNLPDGALYLRARGVDVNGLEGKDATHMFTIKARPLAPALVSPTDKLRLMSERAALSWQASADAASYRLQMGTEVSLANPIVDEPVASGLTFSPAVLLKPATYYWRVASVDGKGEIGPWSPTFSFLGAVDAPMLKAKRMISKMPLEIDTSAAQTHQVQIARDTRFAQMASDRTIVGNAFDLGSLAVNVYYVRVRAVVGDGKVTGPWSETHMLEVYPLGGWWLSESLSASVAPVIR